MQLVSMKRSKTQDKENTVVAADPPDYPYGLEPHMGDEELKRLGIDSPPVGQEMMLMAKVKVTSVSEHASENNQNRNVNLQITDMALGPQRESADHANALYGNKTSA